MIEIDLFGIKTNLRFDFFAAAAFMTALENGKTSALALLCCLLHESGHILMMMIFGAKPSRIIFYGAGIMISPDRHKLLPLYAEALILSAGCAVNFTIYAVCRIIGESAAVFGYINLFLGIFNLLPAAGLDGGRLLRLFLEQRFSCYTAENICRFTGCLTAVLLCSGMYTLGIRNVTVYAASALMLISSLFM